MNAELRDAYRRCHEETRRASSNFYLAFIALPRGRREAIYAIYALLRRWDDIVDSPLPPEGKRRALEEQREKILDLYRDRAQAQAGDDDDPLFLAVRDVIERYRIPSDHFLDVLAGIELDLHKRRYRTFEELKEYCYGVAGAVGLISLEIFGYRDPVAKDYAVDLGIAMQLTNILRDLKEDLERDRIYLPQEDLERFGYSEEELRRGIINEGFRELMRFQVARAREHFQQGLRLLSYLPLRSRPCPAVLAGIYEHILDKIEARGYDVLNSRITLSLWEKAAIALRRSLAGRNSELKM